MELTHNQKIYLSEVTAYLPNEKYIDDRKWLCNQLSQLWRQVKDGWDVQGVFDITEMSSQEISKIMETFRWPSAVREKTNPFTGRKFMYAIHVMD